MASQFHLCYAKSIEITNQKIFLIGGTCEEKEEEIQIRTLKKK